MLQPSLTEHLNTEGSNKQISNKQKESSRYTEEISWGFKRLITSFSQPHCEFRGFLRNHLHWIGWTGLLCENVDLPAEIKEGMCYDLDRQHKNRNIKVIVCLELDIFASLPFHCHTRGTVSSFDINLSLIALTICHFSYVLHLSSSRENQITLCQSASSIFVHNQSARRTDNQIGQLNECLRQIRNIGRLLLS